MSTPSLRFYAGPAALRHLRERGLRPQDVGAIPAAAGGPKGLILGPLDRFIFGQWLPQSAQPVDLVGASIGAWRMATACLDDPAAALMHLQRDTSPSTSSCRPERSAPRPSRSAGSSRATYSASMAAV